MATILPCESKPFAKISVATIPLVSRGQGMARNSQTSLEPAALLRFASPSNTYMSGGISVPPWNSPYPDSRKIRTTYYDIWPPEFYAIKLCFLVG